MASLETLRQRPARRTGAMAIRLGVTAGQSAADRFGDQPL
jgi:hypothetical protein